jgi:hypothetical protein
MRAILLTGGVYEGKTGFCLPETCSSIKSQTYNPFNHEQDWAKPSLGVAVEEFEI